MNYKNANLELYKIGLGCGGMTNLNNKEENIKKSNGKEVIVYREDVIPLVRLNESLDI